MKITMGFLTSLLLTNAALERLGPVTDQCRASPRSVGGLSVLSCRAKQCISLRHVSPEPHAACSILEEDSS